MRASNATLIYYRMLTDAARLREWAGRGGNEQHKAFAKGLEDVLKAKQNLFTADIPMAAKQLSEKELRLAANVQAAQARNSIPADPTEQEIEHITEQGKQHFLAGGSPYDNPHIQGTQRYTEWIRGFNAIMIANDKAKVNGDE